jgi:hypothetical protein
VYATISNSSNDFSDAQNPRFDVGVVAENSVRDSRVNSGLTTKQIQF